MLDESAGQSWVSRRDPRLRRPLATVGRTSPDGIPYLAPEIQLFYKAARPRAKDEADFATVCHYSPACNAAGCVTRSPTPTATTCG
ncbi:MAG TPA: hypothetical protein VGL80_10645 [Pseudonocardiaceae bacterium]